MTTRIGLALVAFAFALATTSSSADAQELVAIGHSGPAGYADGNIFAESQEWAFPALVAQSVGADYSPPSLVGTYSPERLLFLGFTAFPHFGTLEPSPYPGPLPNPTAGQVDMCGLHSGLGVPGETVHGALYREQFPLDPTSDVFGCGSSCGWNPVCTVTCQLYTVSYIDSPLYWHSLFNAFPYSFPLGVSPSGEVFPCPDLTFYPMPRSQVEIASLLEPEWILVAIGDNDIGHAASAGLEFPPVDPEEFDADYQTMMTKLRTDNPDAVIVCANLPLLDVDTAARFATPAEADALLAQGPLGVGLPPTFELLGGLAPDDLVNMLEYQLALLEGYPLEDLKDIVPVLTVEEQAVVNAVTKLYNKSIRKAAKRVGAVYVDLGKTMEKLIRKQGGVEVTVDGQTLLLTFDYGGGLVGFDGGHLTKTGHAVLANFFIEELNAKLKPRPRFKTVDVSEVAATDLHVLRLLD